MLSSVAERVYWFARYLERAENTARLIKVNTLLLLDLPSDLTIGSDALIKITDSEKGFREKFKVASRSNIENFVLGDLDHPSSVRSSIRAARENMRTTRDIMPSDAWEQINGLYNMVDDSFGGGGLKQQERHSFLDSIIFHCQGITGLLAGTMSHGPAYQFLRMGRNLERADMTSRILDSGATIDASKGWWAKEEQKLYHDSLWVNVLRSLSAYQMYKQHVHKPISGTEVAKFVLQDPKLPRAVIHCLNVIVSCMENLPHYENASRSSQHVMRVVSDADEAMLSGAPLREFIDQIQAELLEVGKLIAITWFPKIDKVRDQEGVVLKEALAD